MSSTDVVQLDQTNNGSLGTLLTRCINQPSCMYSMSTEITRARVTKWLRAAQAPRVTPVWVWLNYPKGVPRWIELNMAALRRHAPEPLFKITLLNSSTISQYIQLPPEFGRLRSEVAASDLARLGLLARYGGLYLDADVLVAEPLNFILKLLDEHENVVYTSPGQDCRAGIFSSNFLATRPNSTLWARAYASLNDKLRNKCGGKRVRHRVCCYAQNNTPIPCRSPWGLTDWIMSTHRCVRAPARSTARLTARSTARATCLCWLHSLHWLHHHTACLPLLLLLQGHWRLRWRPTSHSPCTALGPKRASLRWRMRTPATFPPHRLRASPSFTSTGIRSALAPASGPRNRWAGRHLDGPAEVEGPAAVDGPAAVAEASTAAARAAAAAVAAVTVAAAVAQAEAAPAKPCCSVAWQLGAALASSAMTTSAASTRVQSRGM